MKKIIPAAVVTAICCIIAACNSKGATATSDADTIPATAQAAGPYDFSHDAVGYIQKQRICFVDVETKAVQTLTEEPDPVLALCYVPDEEALFYLADKSGSVRLRKAVFADGKATLTELLDTQLTPDDCSESSIEAFRISHHNGKLWFRSHPGGEFFAFMRENIYTIADNKLVATENYEQAQRLLGLQVEEEKDPRFKSKDGQLIFTDNGRTVNLSDQLNIQPDTHFDEMVWHDGFQFSPDGSKIFFQAFNSVGDFYHGPICIANTDGTHQQKLADDKGGFEQWIGNRLLYTGFIHTDNSWSTVIGITNPADNSPTVLVTNIEGEVATFIPAKQ